MKRIFCFSRILATLVALSACTDFQEIESKKVLSVSELELTFTPSAASKSLTVSSGAEWSISGIPTWVSIQEIDNSRYHQYEWDITFAVSENDGPERNGVVAFKTKSEIKRVRVTQSGHPITIDGDFSDWAKLDASKVATAKCDPYAKKTALKLVKVYADEMYVFVYFEWDKAKITHQPDVEHVPFHCYINTDGDAKTGGYADLFSDACTDIMFEGFIYPDGSAVGSYVPYVYEWAGKTNGTGWSWATLGEFSGLTVGAGIEGKYEFQIARKLMPKKLADIFSIGFEIQQGWDCVGVLPNSHDTEDNPGGLAPSLQVSTVK